MKTFLVIKALVWYSIFAFDFTYDRDALSFIWLLLAVVSTITYLQTWIEEKIEAIKPK